MKREEKIFEYKKSYSQKIWITVVEVYHTNSEFLGYACYFNSKCPNELVYGIRLSNTKNEFGLFDSYENAFSSCENHLKEFFNNFE